MQSPDETVRLKREVVQLQQALESERQKCRDDDVAEANRQIRDLEKQLKAERDKPPKVQTKTVTQRDPKDETKINAQRKRILDLEKQLREAQAVHTDRDVERPKERVKRLERVVRKLRSRKRVEQGDRDQLLATIARLKAEVVDLQKRSSDRDQLLATIARLKAEVVDLQKRLPEPEPDVSDEIRRYKHQMGIR